ncbi:hypothetical protein FKW77_005477 [Venturia effusa]|uniref:Uncharacterized protein n=1 Tax=Venturia effusa TaxID=50376 RepID=A0A517KWD3_9PEZI|nr:hypothetical protein FKW77_005477 [Venturia effusa]
MSIDKSLPLWSHVAALNRQLSILKADENQPYSEDNLRLQNSTKRSIQATLDLGRALQAHMTKLQNGLLLATANIENSSEHEPYTQIVSLVEAKKAVEAKIKATRAMAQSCQKIAASNESFINLCWESIASMVPSDAPAEEMTACLEEQCIKCETRSAVLSKDVASLEAFDDEFLELQYFTRDDGSIIVDPSARTWKYWQGWEFGIRYEDGCERTHELEYFKEWYVAKAKTYNRPLEVSKVETYAAIRHLWQM